MTFPEYIRHELRESHFGKWIIGAGGEPASAPASEPQPSPLVTPENLTAMGFPAPTVIPDHTRQHLWDMIPNLEHEALEKLEALAHHVPKYHTDFISKIADTPETAQETEMATAPVPQPSTTAAPALPPHVEKLAATAVKANLVETFFSKVKAELSKLFSHAPSWTQTATSAITYTAPFVEALLSFTDPALEAIVAPIVSKIEAALAAADVVVKDAGPVPTILTYLNAIKGDIQQVISAAQIKDQATQAKFTAITTLIVNEIDAIVAELGTVAA